MKTTNLICNHCGKSFEREIRRHTQCLKKGYKIFCSKSCSITFRNLHTERKNWNYSHILKYAGNKKDQLSPFKYFITKCKERKKQKGDNYDIDLSYLKNLWEKQKGICPYTNIKMILPDTTKSHCKTRSLKKASLDRINSNEGYIKGNVEFVCLFINMAKNNSHKKDVVNFIEEMKVVALSGLEPEIKI